MSTPLWITEAAEEFWHLAGTAEPFPRSLRRSIADALLLTLVQSPHLRVYAAETWLRRCGVVCTIGAGDRPLHAALVARYGAGCLFLDSADDDDEQRLSLAHELAHYLRHYRQLRQRVQARLGTAALEVLDGQRPASRVERIDALLAGVPIGYYVHLMRRDDDGGLPDSRTQTAEREADLLAYELLAPAARVAGEAREGTVAQRRQRTAASLQRDYGLPAAAATEYAGQLVPAPAESFVRQLRVVR